MLDNKIGYIICESKINEELRKDSPTIVSSNNDRVIIEAIIQDADKKNRNGRYYAKEDLFPALESPRIKELLSHKAFVGENGHPMDSSLSRQQTIDPNNICCNFLKIWTEGNLVKAHVKGTPNQKGADFNNLILDGTDPAFSLRALGSITNTKRGAEVKNINIITYDHVFYPSHSVSYAQSIVSEASSVYIPNSVGNLQYSTTNKVVVEENDKGILIPITNESVMSYIKNESANISTILKSFDTLYESATLVENGSKVRLMTHQGDILMINLESYIQNEIMDYCYR